MELSFSELRAKEVVNTQDGRKLGRVCDLVFCYPENRVIGLVVPDNKSFFKKEEKFVAMKDIVRIGEDVILVNLPSDCHKGCPPKGRCAPPKNGAGSGGGFGGNTVGNSGNNAVGNFGNGFGNNFGGDRRSFDEYE